MQLRDENMSKLLYYMTVRKFFITMTQIPEKKREGTNKIDLKN